MGLSRTAISQIVRKFYEKIRLDSELGPIFEKNISVSWDDHLNTMDRFWESVALNLGTYSGSPIFAHKGIKHLSPDHFERWLHVFSGTVFEVTQSTEATSFLFGRAEKIAAVLAKQAGKEAS